MSITLFSFDFESLFNDWQNLFNLPENNLPNTENIADSASGDETASEAGNISAENETNTENIAPQVFSAPVFIPVQSTKPIISNNESFDEFVKTLRGALMHTYQSSDLAGGGMSQNFVADPRGRIMMNNDRKNDDKVVQKKDLVKEEFRTQYLREELRKAVLKPANENNI